MWGKRESLTAKVQGSRGGFAANIYGAMPEGWRIEVRCLMSLSPIPNPQSLIPSYLSLRVPVAASLHVR